MTEFGKLFDEVRKIKRVIINASNDHLTICGSNSNFFVEVYEEDDKLYMCPRGNVDGICMSVHEIIEYVKNYLPSTRDEDIFEALRRIPNTPEELEKLYPPVDFTHHKNK